MNKPLVNYCLVTQNLASIIEDSDYDSDRYPDITDISGVVIFTPNIANGKAYQLVDSEGEAYTVPVSRIQANIVNGKIKHENDTGVYLFAAGAGSNPDTITYSVEYRNLRSGDLSFTLSPLKFEAIPGGEVDLTTVTPVVGATPAGVVRGPRGTSLEDIVVDGTELVFIALDDAHSFEMSRIPLDDMVRVEAVEAMDAASNAVSRVDALEAMSGLSPESPVDGQTANLIYQSDSLTRAAAEDAFSDFLTSPESGLDAASAGLMASEDSLMRSAIREVAITVDEAPLNPYRFGASEPLDNNDDHTLALRAMFEAAATASIGADIWLPPGKWIFKDSDGLGPLPLSSGLKVVGTGSSSSRLYARETDGVALLGSESHVKGIEMRDIMLLISGQAGHIFQTRSIDRATFTNVFFVQQLAEWSIWHHTPGDFIQNVFTSCELQGSAIARVPWFNLESVQGGLNSNTFDKCRFNAMNCTTAPVFRLEERGVGAHVNDWAFRDIILEQTTGGFIHASGASNWILDNVQSWDAQVPHAKDIMRFDTSIGGASAHNLTFRNYSRHGESLAAGVYDINIPNAVPSSGAATFINCNPTPYTRSHSINSPSGKTTYIGTRGYSTSQSSGMGSPEGVVYGSVGDMYTRLDGGVRTTLYVKESGNATTTGWAPK